MHIFGNPKHKEGHFAELTAVLGIAAELRGGKVGCKFEYC